MTRRKLLNTHYRKKDLLERGWTRDMIDRHLGKPDLTSPWNYNDICWYEHARVHSAEQQEEVRWEMDEAARRKEAWRAAQPERVAKRTESEMARLKSDVPRAIHVQVIDQDELERKAAGTRYGRFPSKEVGLVAFVRHNLSNYDELLREHKTGPSLWRYATIKTMVLGAIGESYPCLADECRRQIAKLQNSTRRARQ